MIKPLSVNITQSIVDHLTNPKFNIDKSHGNEDINTIIILQDFYISR